MGALQLNRVHGPIGALGKLHINLYVNFLLIFLGRRTIVYFVYFPGEKDHTVICLLPKS